MVNSRRNVTGVFNCWRKLTPEAIGLVGLAGFREMVKCMSPAWSRKCLVLYLAQRWWDITHTFHIAGREMTMTPLDMYQLTGLNMIGGRVIHILELADDVHLDQIYLGFSAGSTSMNVPSLPDEFSGGS